MDEDKLYTTLIIPTGNGKYVESLDGAEKLCEKFIDANGLEIHARVERGSDNPSHWITHHYLYPSGQSIDENLGLHSVGRYLPNGDRSNVILWSNFSR